METEKRAWKVIDELLAPGPVTIVLILFIGTVVLITKVFNANNPTEVEQQKTTIAEKAGEKTKNVAKDFIKGWKKDK